MRKRFQFDVEKARAMCEAGATHGELAHEFRCSVCTIRRHLRQHGLVAALADCTPRRDPTPEEIAALKLKIKERNLRAYAKEDWETTRQRLWHEGVLQES